MFEDLPTYTLYITAIVRMDTVPFLQRRSPVAILDRYEGTGVEIDAPEWIRNGEEYHRFYQPRGVFAELFAKLALSEHNVSKIHTWPDSSLFGPQTPKKPAQPANMRLYKARHRYSSQVYEQPESPTQVMLN
ncbi:hypothetical protein FIBSPDRAFT_961013 [Athelia psychrophila]|uniref:Uncharacterized protein n=1 Tax=Athelia psychrophila TaxID=1759441 RepID=A0A166BT89_9AGAM|nr:hypothetical protein FIBSPDRAFT_961013 [Fibularhizoctonia sp. CBS 109695]